MKCRIINSSFFCRDEDAKAQESIFRVLRELEDQTKNYSIDQLFGLLVGDVDERFILELIKIRGAKLEAELADKDRQLAEITRLRNAYKKALEMAEDELMTVRAEIESLKLSAGELNGAFNARPKCEKCKDKDKLIEQMREALDATDEYYLDKSYAGEVHNTPIVVKVREAQAALSAAERDEL